MIKSIKTIVNVLAITLLLTQSNQLLAKEVVQIGVATQINKGVNNVEKLRERAIKNAMEMAIMQVTGVQMTSERGGLSAFRDTTFNINGNSHQQQKQINSFHAGAKTKTTGNVKILKIIKEWQKDESYFVEVKLEAANKKDLLKTLNIGDLWLRIDRPNIAVNVIIDRLEQYTQQGKLLQHYLQENLSKNGINTIQSSKKTTRFNIQVRQVFSHSIFTALNTYKSSCNLSFSIIDNETSRSLSDYRISNDDEAGFSKHQSEELCTKKIAQKLSLQLLKELAIIFNNEWSDGKEFLVKLSSLPGKYATKSGNIVANAYQVTDSEIQGFNNNKLLISVMYDGKGFELVDTINTAFIEAGMRVNLIDIKGNQVEFVWLGMDK